MYGAVKDNAKDKMGNLVAENLKRHNMDNERRKSPIRLGAQ
jgi:hypothetical protein